MSDLKQFCSFVVSQPLYLSYFVFFAPYLLKILSFLFPLVFTTSLLLLAFLADGKVGDLLSACHAAVASKIEDGPQECFVLEDFEVYKIVFEGPMMCSVQENPEQSAGAKMEDFSKEVCSVKAEKKVDAGANAEKVARNNGSEEANVSKTKPAAAENRAALSSGSMRKEKEWKRTLACKLYEERHSAEGSGEGMDLLWETYEMDAMKSKAKKKTMKKRYSKESEEEDEEGEVSDQLCCLQALKFSAGKMNLGMGKPNLLKISKAIKGFGWLHHVTKHSKKVHIEDRF